MSSYSRLFFCEKSLRRGVGKIHVHLPCKLYRFLAYEEAVTLQSPCIALPPCINLIERQRDPMITFAVCLFTRNPKNCQRL